MTQIATVLALNRPGLVQVVVARQTACGHDCEKCAGCGAQAGSITVLARTDIPVQAGDKVELYSDNRVLGFAAVVYLLPVLLFLLGYFLTPGFGETARYLFAGLGFALGLGGAVVCDRLSRRRGVSYQIVKRL